MRRCTLNLLALHFYEADSKKTERTQQNALASASECHYELTNDLRCAKQIFSTRFWFVFGTFEKYFAGVGIFRNVHEKDLRRKMDFLENECFKLQAKHCESFQRASFSFSNFPHFSRLSALSLSKWLRKNDSFQDVRVYHAFHRKWIFLIFSFQFLNFVESETITLVCAR